jgi:hypothetical protein
VGVVTRPAGSPNGLVEIVVGLSCYGVYLAVRHRVWNDRGRGRARANAMRVAAFERRAGIAVEPIVQRMALRVPGISSFLNASYAAGNVALSVGWLLLLFGRRDPDFRRERAAAVVAFAGALPVFVLAPTAPPRSLEGFVDTFGGPGRGLDDPRLVRFYNPIAAMPSHHLAFATVTGLGLAARRRSWPGRAVWTAYPAAVAVVVVATANHFVVDVLAGAALGLFARRITRRTIR